MQPDRNKSSMRGVSTDGAARDRCPCLRHAGPKTRPPGPIVFLGDDPSRRGIIVVLAAFLMVVVFGFVAFTVDIGFITLVKAQMQAASDAATLAACLELTDALGPYPLISSDEAQENALEAAAQLAEMHPAGELSSLALDPQDVQFGRYEWNSTEQTWVATWGAPPFNAVRVTLRRGTTAAGGIQGGDSVNPALPLFFAPVLGQQTAALETKAASAALMPGRGFRIAANQTVPVLPITIDQPRWKALLAGDGEDNFEYDPETGKVIPGSDGILELNIYPGQSSSNGNSGNGKKKNNNGNGGATGQNQWTPGNWGTVDFGNSNNSTAELERQIKEGLNEQDLSYFGGKLDVESGPLLVNGDTGISAAIQKALQQIVGQVRALPLFISVSGQGNNTTYTIVEFVPVRILEAELSGGDKRVTVQPAVLVHPTVVPSQITVDSATMFTTPRLIA